MSKRVAATASDGYSTTLLTRAQFVAEITAMERAPHHRDLALDRATFAALPRPLPAIPGLRLAVAWCSNGHPLPSDWGIYIEADETLIYLSPLPEPYVGVVALVARVADLPCPSFDEAAEDRIAEAIADAFCRTEGVP